LSRRVPGVLPKELPGRNPSPSASIYSSCREGYWGFFRRNSLGGIPHPPHLFIQVVEKGTGGSSEGTPWEESLTLLIYLFK